MDSRIYFHQYRRPRYDNPTQQRIVYKSSSSNVGNSLTYFNSRHTSPSYNQQQQNYNRSSINNYSMDNANRSNYNRTIQNASRGNNEQNQMSQGSNNYNNDRSNYNVNTSRVASNLSNYGTNSLSFNQKDVYNKQNQKFDIISLRPKQFQTTIKQYPKYSLQNKDQIYYRRMVQQNQQRKLYADKAQMSKNSKNPDFIAGKHTYADQRRIAPNSQNPQRQKYFSAKMLNHMDELAHLS